MTELGEIFAELGISHYLNDFLEQGFDTWDTILDITESDFDALGVKLGHRRKLQRKIANSRGLSSDRALASPTRNTTSDDRQLDDQRAGGLKADAKDGGGSGPHGAKRKYRRHPKPDENAPERPPSAYVIFSNKVREKLKGRNLSFTEIAKLVGENWQNLSPSEKEPYEQQAFSAKEKYNNELSEYKKTSNFKGYAQYLAEFKARQSTQQQVTDLDVVKRPKLEAHPSTTSSGTASSGASQQGDTPTGRTQVQWARSNSQPSPPSQSSSVPRLADTHSRLTDQGSPNNASPAALPGYRESIVGGMQHILTWREPQRDDPVVPMQQLPRITNLGERRLSYTGSPVSEALSISGSLPHTSRMRDVQPPPLSSGSTIRSSASSASTSSSYFTPRTPMNPSLDRALPVPPLYPQKASVSFENQLPPLRPPSLSPQSSLLRSAQQSPNGIQPSVDFPTPMAPMRGYATATSPLRIPADGQDSRVREVASAGSRDDNLDPVSALLKAGEIDNRNSRVP